jgi:hypothetical protein
MSYNHTPGPGNAFPVSDERNEYNGAARLQRRSPPLARTTPVAGDEWLPPVT